MNKETLVNKILSMFKTESIKSEIKNICVPILNILLKELYPYIYFSFFFIIVSFLLNLAILFSLVRKKIIF